MGDGLPTITNDMQVGVVRCMLAEKLTNTTFGEEVGGDRKSVAKWLDPDSIGNVLREKHYNAIMKKIEPYMVRFKDKASLLDGIDLDKGKYLGRNRSDYSNYNDIDQMKCSGLADQYPSFYYTVTKYKEIQDKLDNFNSTHNKKPFTALLKQEGGVLEQEESFWEQEVISLYKKLVDDTTEYIDPIIQKEFSRDTPAPFVESYQKLNGLNKRGLLLEAEKLAVQLLKEEEREKAKAKKLQ